jgi:glycosyltransferase involved in cell wall biosynthesis
LIEAYTETLTPVPEVSVVLPVWNGERFLAEAIESLLGQTFRAFELIVVDDGSTDRSAEIAQELACRDPRIVLLPRRHEGFARTLNAGIEAARGRYVARMDDDDIALPGRLEKQVAHLEAHPDCVAVGAWVEVIDEAGRYLGVKTFADTNADITSALLRGSSPLSHPTVVVRLDALRAVGGYAVDRYPSEDFDLWLKLSALGQLANIREPLLQYRRHQGAVGVRDLEQQFAVGAAIVDAERKKRHLRPLRRRFLSPGRNHRARYHFECARIALVAGPRLAAIRHAGKSIASEPRWPDPYATLVACMLPKRMLRFMAELYARFRSSELTDR